MSSPFQAAWDFKDANIKFCKEIEQALKPIIPDGLNTDIYVTIRNGKLSVTPSPMYRGEGWLDTRKENNRG